MKRVPCLNSAAGGMTSAESIPQNWVLDTRGFTTWVRIPPPKYTIQSHSHHSLNLVFQSGKTRENGSLVQGDGTCHPGTYDYVGDTHNEPVTNKAGDYAVQLVCTWEEDASAFFLNPT